VAFGSPATADILVAAAFDPELEPLRQILGAGLRGRVGERCVVARAVGIGLPDAAVGAARLLAEIAAPVVVLTGTCGAYEGASLALDSVIASRRVYLADALALAGASQYPAPMLTAIDADPLLVESMERAGARPVDVAATLAITVDGAAASSLRQRTGASVEHLEAFAVAMACRRAQRRFVAVLGVANAVGARAREEWRAHQAGASEAAAAAVARWLGAGAPGVEERG
jgi:nucleoside phosphorylase